MFQFSYIYTDSMYTSCSKSKPKVWFKIKFNDLYFLTITLDLTSKLVFVVN